MLKRTITIALMLIGVGVNAQEKSLSKTEINEYGQEVTTILPSSFKKTIAVRDLPGVDPSENIPKITKKATPRNVRLDNYKEVEFVDDVDGALQKSFGAKALNDPNVNFNGLSGSGYPPDPSGAAGPNHYVQAVNSSYRVYDKQGGIETQQFALGSLFSNSPSKGDPIVMYDRHADRWFISQFNYSGVQPQPPYKIQIAISQTPDPTGEYYAYEFVLSSFPDYPKYSIWWDGYYMTSNSQHTAVVFEREKMLAGDPSAQMVSLSLPSMSDFGFKSALPSDADGDLPPDGTPCYFFNLADNAFAGGQDRIQIYEFTTNWQNTSSSAVVQTQQLPVQSFDALFSGGFSNISQPGTSQKLDAIQGIFMYRAQHMRWFDHNSMMLSHAVDLGSNRSGIRWYELRDNNDGVWQVYQQSTYAPDNTSRWMSSVAMDKHGHIGMAYSVSNPSQNLYPGIRYTGRVWWSPLNEMDFEEKTAVEGGGSQVGIDRYGDYAHLSLDPDGETFWYTGEYINNSGSPRTRIFSFSIEEVAGLDEDPYYSGLEFNAFYANGQLKVNASGVVQNEKLKLQVIGMDGKVIYSSDLMYAEGGELQKEVDVSKLSSGIYFVRFGNKNFQESAKFVVNK